MRRLLAFLFILSAGVAQAQEYKVPALTGPVVDNARIIDGNTSAALEQGIRQLRDQGGTQITVLTVESLGGLSIEEASIKTTDQWKLGGAKTDKGVLLLVAPNERRVRIEVGQGLEGQLTDAYSNRIVRDVITPSFKQGDYSGGILNGVVAIVKHTDPSVDTDSLFFNGVPAPTVRNVERSGGRSGLPIGKIIFFLVILFFIIGRGGGGGRRRRGMSPWTAGALGYGLGRSSGGGWGGGGGGFGGGGGGGWSGGGGGFSGGGASGGW